MGSDRPEVGVNKCEVGGGQLRLEDGGRRTEDDGPMAGIGKCGSGGIGARLEEEGSGTGDSKSRVGLDKCRVEDEPLGLGDES